MPPLHCGEGGARPTLHRRYDNGLSVKMHALNLSLQLTCRPMSFVRCRCCTIIAANVEALASHSHPASYWPNPSLAPIGQLGKLVLLVTRDLLLATCKWRIAASCTHCPTLYGPSHGKSPPSRETGSMLFRPAPLHAVITGRELDRDSAHRPPLSTVQTAPHSATLREGCRPIT